jgi:antirestriction protein
LECLNISIISISYAIYERTKNMKIFITNLAKYNEGVLRGEWVCLPMDEKKLQSKINNILESDEEFFITDYEAPIKIEEYDNIADLNEFAEKLDGIRERDEVIEAISKDVLGDGYSRNELLRVLSEREYCVVEDVWTQSDLAIKIEESLLPFDYQAVEAANVSGYIDWDAVGRDMVIEGWNITGNGLAVKVFR